MWKKIRQGYAVSACTCVCVCAWVRVWEWQLCISTQRFLSAVEDMQAAGCASVLRCSHVLHNLHLTDRPLNTNSNIQLPSKKQGYIFMDLPHPDPSITAPCLASETHYSMDNTHLHKLSEYYFPCWIKKKSPGVYVPLMHHHVAPTAFHFDPERFQSLVTHKITQITSCKASCINNSAWIYVHTN